MLKYYFKPGNNYFTFVKLLKYCFRPGKDCFTFVKLRNWKMYLWCAMWLNLCWQSPWRDLDYTIVGDQTSMNFLTVDNNGWLTLKRPLTETTQSMFNVSFFVFVFKDGNCGPFYLVVVLLLMRLLVVVVAVRCCV